MSLNIKKGKLSYALLSLLEGAIDGAVLFNDFANNPGNYSIFGRDYPLKKFALSKAIARLKEKGLIEKQQKEDGDIILKLTDDGKTALLLMDDKEEKWDGKWRIVIFDIPEQKRLIRDLLRRNLKKWGFKPLQKSVWISKKHVTRKLVSYVKYLKVEEWVLIIESDKIGPRPII